MVIKEHVETYEETIKRKKLVHTLVCDKCKKEAGPKENSTELDGNYTYREIKTVSIIFPSVKSKRQMQFDTELCSSCRTEYAKLLVPYANIGREK